MALFDKLFEKKETELRESVLDDPTAIGSVFGSDMTIYTAMSIPSVNACVRLIADSVASLPIEMYRTEGENKIQVKDDYRLRLINKETGDLLDAWQLKQNLVKDYILTGGGYFYVNWSGSKIKSLNYIDPRAVGYSKGGLHIFKEAIFNIDGQQYQEYVIARLLRHSNYGIRGKGIVQENAKHLELLNNTQNYQARAAKSGSKLVLQPNVKKTQEVMNGIKAAWDRLYNDDSGNTIMILNEDIKLNQLQAQTDTTITSTKEYANQEVCSILNVPYPLLTGKATSEEYRVFINDCLTPIIRAFENVLNRFLLLEKEKGQLEFKFDTDALSTSSMSERMTAYATALNNGIYSMNEVRVKENLNPLEDDFFKMSLNTVIFDPESGDIQNINMGTVSKIGEEVQAEEVKEDEV